jgi:adenine-specific DNA methylase
LVAVLERDSSGAKRFRAPEDVDLKANRAAVKLLERMPATEAGVSAVPDERIPPERPSPNARGLSAVTRAGMKSFGDLYTPRQALVLATLAKAVRDVTEELRASGSDQADLLNVLLAAAVSKRADFGSSLCSWRLGASCVRGTFARQALANTWDFGEMYPFAGSAGDWTEACAFIDKFLTHLVESRLSTGSVITASATCHPLPDDAVEALVTDPPYYDSVPYADLSDFFYVWLRRSLTGRNALPEPSSPKDGEIIWNPTRRVGDRPKDKQFYEEQMTAAFREARRVTKPDGIAVVVFAHKSTAGWEAVLEALVKAGWIATGSWPLDTERAGRTNAVGTASLGSSVHIVCRPREYADGALAESEVGAWREVLEELPRRIHDWMPRLAREGIVGADAIFACLGPALEVFSRYARVEKANGDAVGLREYLEQVWAAVSREALSMIFSAADASGLEADARITAMWLWTLVSPAAPEASGQTANEEDEEDDEDTDAEPDDATPSGFILDFDTARKIAQGLGARLDELETVVQIHRDKARLLPVAERAKYVFGRAAGAPSTKKAGKKKQMSLFADLEEAAEAQSWGEAGAPKAGATTLDRVHQAMLLFGSGRGEALKRFLVEEGVGKQSQFWKLAQSLSALYPSGSDEKRWVDGVLARKKGLGFG